jgi:hypothetical protein
MRAGDFETAWKVSRCVLDSTPGPDPRLPRHLQAVWDGTPLAGRRVLVHCYHGLGDTLQFVRYLPLVQRLAAETLLWAQPELLPLLRSAAGIDRLLPLHDGPSEATREVDVEIMELPFVLRSTPTTLPAHVPYLHAEPLRAQARDGAMAVGLVWQAGDWDPHRSIPTGTLAPLARVPGVRIHVLQQGPARRELTEGFGTASGSRDILGLARLMRGLDLVVTVDSMPAHLAGALGIPVWTLLHRHPDWRWLEGREDSPWYPTMRLFRQERAGDWESVIARVAAALAAGDLSPPSARAPARRRAAG